MPGISLTGDQTQMLYKGYLGAYQGIWLSYGNAASAMGNVPGSLSAYLVGLPLLLIGASLIPYARELLAHPSLAENADPQAHQRYIGWAACMSIWFSRPSAAGSVMAPGSLPTSWSMAPSLGGSPRWSGCA